MLKKFFFIVFVSLLVAGQALAQQASYLTNSTVTMETDGTNPDGSANIQTNNAGRIQFFTNRTLRGYIDGTTGVLTGFTLGTTILTSPTISGNLTFSTAAAKIIPGATSLTFRNNADSQDNVSIANNGQVTFASDLLLSSAGSPNILASASALRIGTNNNTALTLRANSADRWSISTAGALTQDATNGGDIVLNATNGFIRQGTSSSSDTNNIKISGAGETGDNALRGGKLRLYGINDGTFIGNAYLQAPGNLALGAGTTATGSRAINFETYGLTRWAVDESGNFNQNVTNGSSIVFAKTNTGIVVNSSVTTFVKVNASGNFSIQNSAGSGMWTFAADGTLNQGGSGGSDLVFNKAGTAISLKSGGAAATSGTFVCNGVTGVVVSSTSASASMVLAFSPNTIAGTAPIGSPYVSAFTAGTSFTVKCSIAGETSTYNWALVKVT